MFLRPRWAIPAIAILTWSITGAGSAAALPDPSAVTVDPEGPTTPGVDPAAWETGDTAPRTGKRVTPLVAPIPFKNTQVGWGLMLMLGAIHRFDAGTGPLPARVFRSSTHAFGVGDAVELARALGRLPAKVVVYGVEGAGFDAGAALSEPARGAVEAVAESILVEVEEMLCTSGR